VSRQKSVGMKGKLAASVIIVGILLAGCAHRERAASPSVSPSAPATTSVVAPSQTGTRSNVPAPHVLDDGQHAAYLTAIDVPARTVTFDVIQFLTGEAADEAFHQDHPEIEGGVPNGYYIRNENPRLRTLSVRVGVPVRVVWLGEGAQLESISFEELPAYFAGDLEPGDQYLWYDPFWLTVHGDRVELIVEQYIP
jgi:hypothetical protein